MADAPGAAAGRTSPQAGEPRARVLLLLTVRTYRAQAFLEAAARLGLLVTVGSDRPQVLAAADPAGTLTLDFSDPDRSARDVVRFGRAYPLSAVLAADDEGVVLAAGAAAALGLRHSSVEAVATARDKLRMREALARAGLPSPGFVRVSLEEEPGAAAARAVTRGLRFPSVVKPLSLSASRGVIRADDPHQLAAALERTGAILRRSSPELPEAHAREVLIEDYIPGTEVALEGLLSGGRLRVLALYDKPDPLEGPFFEETIYLTPSRLRPEVQGEIAACAATAAEALGLSEGPVHAELRVNERGAWILEIAPRSIGGLCARTLRFADSRRPGDGAAWISLEELILRHALGMEVDSIERERLAAGVMMIPIPGAGVLREVRGRQAAESVPGVEDVRITIPVGQEVVPLPEGGRYLGFIFARAASPEQVERALRTAHGRLELAIEPPAERAAARPAPRTRGECG